MGENRSVFLFYTVNLQYKSTVVFTNKKTELVLVFTV